MKKQFWIGAAVAAAVLAGGSALANEAKIMSVTGEAFIVNRDGIHRAKPGMSCEAGDMVMTHEGCQLDLSVAGQAGCRMLPGTTVAVASVRPEIIKLVVAEGNVVLNVKKLASGSEFVVDTPAAVAAVRGTQFWGRVTGGESASPVTTFAVREGSVQIFDKASEQSVTLKAGQAADLAEHTGQPRLRAALPAEMNAMAVADQIAVSA